MIDPNALLSNEIEFIIAKGIAETDSIGEGYGYCGKYTKEMHEAFSPEKGWSYREAAQTIINDILEALGYNSSEIRDSKFES